MTNKKPEPGPPTGSKPLGRPRKGTEARTKVLRARITPTAYAWLTRHTDNIADAIEQMAREKTK